MPLMSDAVMFTLTLLTYHGALPAVPVNVTDDTGLCSSILTVKVFMLSTFPALLTNSIGLNGCPGSIS